MKIQKYAIFVMESLKINMLKIKHITKLQTIIIMQKEKYAEDKLH